MIIVVEEKNCQISAESVPELEIITIPTPERIIITDPEELTTIITVPPQGPAGPPGTGTFQKIAGENLGGHRVVTSDASGNAVYASASEVAHANRILGITIGAALSGGTADIMAEGAMDMAGWTWNTTLPVFLGENGNMTQSPPTSGFICIVGFPQTPTKLYVRISQSIILGE